jgi:hypothetical protein
VTEPVVIVESKKVPINGTKLTLRLMLTTACASQFPFTGCVVKLTAQCALTIIAHP